MVNLNGQKESFGATEKKILDAARHEFIENGLTGARMQSIAHRAEVNKALLHYYFRSKEKLYEAVLRNIAETFLGSLRKCLELDNDQVTIESLLRQFVTAYINTMSENPEFPRMLLRELADGGRVFPELMQQLFQKISPFPLKLKDTYLSAVQKGMVRSFDPIHLYLSIMGMCAVSFLVQPVISKMPDANSAGFTFDTAFNKARIESILSLLMHGLLPDQQHDHKDLV